METKTIYESLKDEILLEVKPEVRDFWCGYDCVSENNYLSDLFMEFADNSVNVYSYNQRQFFFENTELCDAAFIEYGYETSDLLRKSGPMACIEQAGACGMFKQTFDALNDAEREICKLYALDYLESYAPNLDKDTIERVLDDLDYYQTISEIYNDVILILEKVA